MALHFKHIKAFNGDSTNTYYTFLEFQGKNDKTEKSLPRIFIDTKNNNNTPKVADGATDYGHIVTNSVETTFYEKVNLMKDLIILGQNDITIKNNQGNLHIGMQGQLSFEGLDGISSKIKLLSTASDSKAETGKADFEVRGYSYFAKDIYTLGSCTAKFFNATSDIRAKENIEPVSESMLKIVDRIQLYTFNYKTDPKERILGVLAQELKDVNINGATFVDNINASGENGDFMTVRETKLIYVLLGAVQELSKEVKELKEKLGE